MVGIFMLKAIRISNETNQGKAIDMNIRTPAKFILKPRPMFCVKVGAKVMFIKKSKRPAVMAGVVLTVPASENYAK